MCWHEWKEWSAIKVAEWGGREVYIQTRFCKKCNKAQVTDIIKPNEDLFHIDEKKINE